MNPMETNQFEYIAPTSYMYSFPALGDTRREGYSQSITESSSKHRKLLIGSLVCFLIVQLTASVTVIGVAQGIHSKFVSQLDNLSVDQFGLWCTVNSSLFDHAVFQPVWNNTFHISGGVYKELDFYCIDRQDSLSKIYENVQKQRTPSDSSRKEKIFDGIRVNRIKNILREADSSIWPRATDSIIRFDKTTQTFYVDKDATVVVCGQVQFNCTRTADLSHLNYQQILKIISGVGQIKATFIDERVEIKSDRWSHYSSSICTTVELLKGDKLNSASTPDECIAENTVVVYHLRDIV